jgi:hypothetical protein
MHFWNKLSTAALMRLTILVSLNLLLGRLVGRWDVLLHPWFFLIVVTLNLGLYAIMVYTGTLNKTLIGMMLGGLVATLGILAFTGMDARAFMYGGPFRPIGREVQSLINLVLESLPARIYAGGPLVLWNDGLSLIGYGVADAFGLIPIAVGGWIARRLNAETRSPAPPTAPPAS